VDWQAIAVIGTLATAIITGFVAYLNYRTRPLLVRTKEKHSEDLKEILGRWSVELGSTDFVPPLSLPKKRCGLPLPVEKHVLFADLRKHMPAGFDVYNEWQIFRVYCHGYDVGRATLCDRIRSDVDRETRLPFTDSCTTWRFAIAIYEDAILLAQGENQKWLEAPINLDTSRNEIGNRFVASAEGVTIVETYDKGQRDMATNHFKTVLQNLTSTGTRESEYVVEAKRLFKMHSDLIRQHQELLRSISELLVIPILAGECEHIQRGREPLFPFIARFKSRVSDTQIEVDRFNPLSLGIIFFSLCPLLLASGQLSLLTKSLLWFAFVVSSCLLLGIVLEPLYETVPRFGHIRDFLNLQARHFFLRSASVIFLVVFLVGWLNSLSGEGGVARDSVFWLGAVWFLVLVRAWFSDVPQYGLIPSALFVAFGLVYLLRSHFLEGSILVVFGILLISLLKWVKTRYSIPP
jgi:hypothetical protein